MSDKDTILLIEEYKKIREDIDHFITGPQSDENIPPEYEKQSTLLSHAFKIMSELAVGKIGKELGFVNMIDSKGILDGVKATLEHEDGNQYEIIIKVL